jgi:hypothetical protein
MNKFKHKLNNLEFKLSGLLNFIYKEKAHEIIKTSNKLDKSIKKEIKKFTTSNLQDTLASQGLDSDVRVNNKRAGNKIFYEAMPCGKALRQTLAQPTTPANNFTYIEYLKYKNSINKQNHQNKKDECIKSEYKQDLDFKITRGTKPYYFKNNKLLPYSDYNSAKFYTVFF